MGGLRMSNGATGHSNQWPYRWGSHELVGFCWIGMCLIGTYLAMSYDFQAGRLGPRLAAWPTGPDYSYSLAPIQPPTKTTVLAFLHPRCVCTRATVTQLVKAFEAHPGADLMVSVFTPLNGARDKAWGESSEYVRTIQAAIPSAKIIWDRGGIQAWRFGAFTSGTILVYDAKGQEIFRGGITDQRGGERDNPGLQRLSRLLTGERMVEADSTPVFGCSLVAPGETPRAERHP